MNDTRKKAILEKEIELVIYNKNEIQWEIRDIKEQIDNLAVIERLDINAYTICCNALSELCENTKKELNGVIEKLEELKKEMEKYNNKSKII